MSKMLKPLARVTGNFGLSFFIPLGSINIADDYFSINQSLEVLVMKSLIIATVYTGISAFREILEFGNKV